MGASLHFGLAKSSLASLLDPHMLLPLFCGLLVAVSCGLIGPFVVLRRMSFLGDALSHAMLAGVVIGYIVMGAITTGQEVHTTALLAGALLSSLFVAACVGLLARARRVQADTAIGIAYSAVFALGGFLATSPAVQRVSPIHIDLAHFILGNLSTATTGHLWTAAIVAAVCATVVLLGYRALVATSFDASMAQIMGLSGGLIGGLLLVCMSLVVVSGVYVVGAVLVIGLLLAPAGAGLLLSRTVGRMIAWSVGICIASVLAGLWLAVQVNMSAGPGIVLVATGFFLLALFFAPSSGLAVQALRRWRAADPRDLDAALDAIAGPIDPAAPAPAQPARPAVCRALRRRGLIQPQGSGWSLTPAGHEHLGRGRRAHQLWEAFLARVGQLEAPAPPAPPPTPVSTRRSLPATADPAPPLPPAVAHDRARTVQHISDEQTLAYLDHRLDHPERAVSGEPIQPDLSLLRPGACVRASLLRNGCDATILAFDEAALAQADLPIRTGQRIRLLEREGDGRQYVLQLDDLETTLTHPQADAILVRLHAVPWPPAAARSGDPA